MQLAMCETPCTVHCVVMNMLRTIVLDSLHIVNGSEM